MSDVSNLIVAEGDEAREMNERQGNGRKVVFLKEGQSFRGRFIGTDFKAFIQHGKFVSKGSPKNIPSHACLDPKAKREGRETTCPSCKADVPKSTRTLVFWYNIDTDQIVVRDVAKKNMASIYDVVDTYADTIGDTVFKVAQGTQGALSILPVPAKKGETFPPTPEDLVIDAGILTYVMGVRTEAEILELIAGKTGDQANDENAETADASTNETDKF